MDFNIESRKTPATNLFNAKLVSKIAPPSEELSWPPNNESLLSACKQLLLRISDGNRKKDDTHDDYNDNNNKAINLSSNLCDAGANFQNFLLLLSGAINNNNNNTDDSANNPIDNDECQVILHFSSILSKYSLSASQSRSPFTSSTSFISSSNDCHAVQHDRDRDAINNNVYAELFLCKNEHNPVVSCQSSLFSPSQSFTHRNRSNNQSCNRLTFFAASTNGDTRCRKYGWNAIPFVLAVFLLFAIPPQAKSAPIEPKIPINTPKIATTIISDFNNISQIDERKHLVSSTAPAMNLVENVKYMITRNNHYPYHHQANRIRSHRTSSIPAELRIYQQIMMKQPLRRRRMLRENRQPIFDSEARIFDPTLQDINLNLVRAATREPKRNLHVSIDDMSHMSHLDNDSALMMAVKNSNDRSLPPPATAPIIDKLALARIGPDLGHNLKAGTDLTSSEMHALVQSVIDRGIIESIDDKSLRYLIQKFERSSESDKIEDFMDLHSETTDDAGNSFNIAPEQEELTDDEPLNPEVELLDVKHEESEIDANKNNKQKQKKLWEMEPDNDKILDNGFDAMIKKSEKLKSFNDSKDDSLAQSEQQNQQLVLSNSNHQHTSAIVNENLLKNHQSLEQVMDMIMHSENTLKKRADRAQLSIESAIVVLRERMLMELARRRAKEIQAKIEENNQILRNLGKRSVPINGDKEATTNVRPLQQQLWQKKASPRKRLSALQSTAIDCDNHRCDLRDLNTKWSNLHEQLGQSLANDFKLQSTIINADVDSGGGGYGDYEGNHDDNDGDNDDYEKNDRVNGAKISVNLRPGHKFYYPNFDFVKYHHNIMPSYFSSAYFVSGGFRRHGSGGGGFSRQAAKHQRLRHNDKFNANQFDEYVQREQEGNTPRQRYPTPPKPVEAEAEIDLEDDYNHPLLHHHIDHIIVNDDDVRNNFAYGPKFVTAKFPLSYVGESNTVAGEISSASKRSRINSRKPLFGEISGGNNKQAISKILPKIESKVPSSSLAGISTTYYIHRRYPKILANIDAFDIEESKRIATHSATTNNTSGESKTTSTT